jgi:nicotinamidase-related amidase
MSAADTGLLIVDVQEKLMAKIPGAARVVSNLSFLVDAARLLEMTVQATEQYPKGLGPTVPELLSKLPVRPAKVGFSCCAVPSIPDQFHRAACPKIVLAGIETHVCVLHTALDLLALGFRVYVAADCVAGRSAVDHKYALKRLNQAGAILTTSETCVFEWVGGADHPRFKDISWLVQARMKSEGL